MRSALALATALMGGCLERFGPDVGAALDSSGMTACDPDSDPSTDVSFASDLEAGVFARGDCLRCHTSGGGGGGQGQGGFDLSTYTNLRAGGDRSGTDIVIDGQPCTSVLLLKVEDAPPFGSRMPRGQSALSAADITLIHDWIAEGARDN